MKFTYPLETVDAMLALKENWVQVSFIINAFWSSEVAFQDMIWPDDVKLTSETADIFVLFEPVMNVNPVGRVTLRRVIFSPSIWVELPQTEKLNLMFELPPMTM